MIRCFAGLFVMNLLTSAVLSAVPRKEVIAYVFVKDRVIQPGEIDAKKLTRINYAFANISGGELVEGFPHDAENYAALADLKKSNPSLLVLASVGGWTWSGGFSDMAQSAGSRSKFIESAVRFINKYRLDGIDIDWEYPGMPGIGNPNRPEDKNNFTLLLQELRARCDREEKKLGRHLTISIAAGASTDYLAHTEMDQVARYVDTVNLMTYDFYDASSGKITGHHAPLHANSLDPKGVSAEGSVSAFLAAGVPAEKLVLGVPFYGHAWSDVGGARFGLFQPGKPSQVDASYKNISEVLVKNGYMRHWDEAAGAPFLYNPATRTFLSYEDAESISLKARFVRQKKLRGMMFWEYYADDNGALLGTMWRSLNRD